MVVMYSLQPQHKMNLLKSHIKQHKNSHIHMKNIYITTNVSTRLVIN